jgi:hypothetical protein
VTSLRRPAHGGAGMQACHAAGVGVAGASCICIPTIPRQHPTCPLSSCPSPVYYPTVNEEHPINRTKLIAVLCALTLHGTAALAEPGLQVQYFQEAAYNNELTTFVLQCQPAKSITVKLNDKQIHTSLPKTETAELYLALTEPGILQLQQDTSTAVFHVVAPSDDVDIKEQDGYLYSSKGPVILLATHLTADKHSRKWEAVKFVKRIFNDTRTKITSATMIGSAHPGTIDSTKMAELSGTKPEFWTCVQPPIGLKEIDSLAANLNNLKPADIAVLALSDTDFERNMDECQLQIKLEWCLQTLKHKGFNHKTFVIPPPFDKHQKERFKNSLARLYLVCSANGAVCTRMPDPADGDTPDETAMKSMLREISRFVRW